MPNSRPSAQYRSPWDAITGLPMADQLEMHESWGEYLGLGPGHPTDVARKRELLKLAVDCLRRAMEHHSLPDRQAPIIREYRDAHKALGLELSWQQIWRAFGGWRWAQEACVSEQTQPSAKQASHSRATRGIRRVGAPYIEQVKTWLDQDPPSTTDRDHEECVLEYNDNLPPGAQKLVLPGTIVIQLGISWEDVKAVARGEMSPRSQAASSSGLEKDRPTRSRLSFTAARRCTCPAAAQRLVLGVVGLGRRLSDAGSVLRLAVARPGSHRSTTTRPPPARSGCPR